MRREIFQTSNFTKAVHGLLKKKKLLQEDFDLFKRHLIEHPDEGDVIPGAGGIRKARLKSASKGKSGGFRVCYFDDPEKEQLVFMWIYAKNEQESLSFSEKKALKELAEIFKRR